MASSFTPLETNVGVINMNGTRTVELCQVDVRTGTVTSNILPDAWGAAIRDNFLKLLPYVPMIERYGRPFVELLIGVVNATGDHTTQIRPSRDRASGRLTIFLDTPGVNDSVLIAIPRTAEAGFRVNTPTAPATSNAVDQTARDAISALRDELGFNGDTGYLVAADLLPYAKTADLKQYDAKAGGGLQMPTSGADAYKFSVDGTVVTTAAAPTAANAKSAPVVKSDGSGYELVIVATKADLDAIVAGLKYRDAVKKTLFLSALPTAQEITDAALAVGDRYLLLPVSGTAATTLHGVYVVTAQGSTRATDFAVGANAGGSYVFDINQTTGGTAYVCKNAAGSDVVGTNPLSFTEYSVGKSYDVADVSLVRTQGTKFSVNFGGGAAVALAAQANAGTSSFAARADHVHPTTGLVALTTANTFTNTNTFQGTTNLDVTTFAKIPTTTAAIPGQPTDGMLSTVKYVKDYVAASGGTYYLKSGGLLAGAASYDANVKTSFTGTDLPTATWVTSQINTINYGYDIAGMVAGAALPTAKVFIYIAPRNMVVDVGSAHRGAALTPPLQSVTFNVRIYNSPAALRSGTVMQSLPETAAAGATNTTVSAMTMVVNTAGDATFAMGVQGATPKTFLLSAGQVLAVESPANVGTMMDLFFTFKATAANA